MIYNECHYSKEFTKLESSPPELVEFVDKILVHEHSM